MAIEYDADNNSKNLAGSDDEWYNVLLKLLDHPVDENLADGGENGQDEKIGGDLWVPIVEVDGQFELARNNSISKGQDGDPFVDVLKHFHRSWMKLGFDCGLEIRQEPISHQRYHKQNDSKRIRRLFLMLLVTSEVIKNDS